MLQNQHAQAAEMHINAAYAHAAAGCEHSTGDHLSTQDLARTAYERSLGCVLDTPRSSTTA